MTMVEAAQRYAQAGWAVLPLKPGGKAPASAHGVKDATTDPEVSWWEAEPSGNIGIATGQVSGVVVIDVDRVDDVTQELVDQFPPTATVQTPRGFHYYFAAPPEGLRNSASKLAPGIDVRADGGYVVAPPSILANGQQYRWISKVRPAPLPGWVLEQLTTRPDPEVGEPNHPFRDRRLATAAVS